MSARTILALLFGGVVLGACSEQAPPTKAPAPVDMTPPAVAAPAPAPTPVSPTELARQTLDAIRDAESLLAAAVRQRDTRGGKDDFWRFIEKPLTDMQVRWGVYSHEDNLNWIPCIVGLQEYVNFTRDSFKSGEIGKPNSLLTESRRECEKLAVPKS